MELASGGYLPSREADNMHHKKLIWMISSLVADANRDAIFSELVLTAFVLNLGVFKNKTKGSAATFDC